jgi:DNA-binding HxlR family transcriptional regulator
MVLLIPLLREGPQRNGQLIRRIGGISQKMLTQSLRALERRRLVIRRVHKDVPPHVEYELSPLGHSLAEAISVLDEWVVRNYHRTTEGPATAQNARRDRRVLVRAYPRAREGAPK